VQTANTYNKKTKKQKNKKKKRKKERRKQQQENGSVHILLLLFQERLEVCEKFCQFISYSISMGKRRGKDGIIAELEEWRFSASQRASSNRLPMHHPRPGQHK